jgi:hypothetical protein
MAEQFKILETGNFYFPITDKGKEFIVESTIDVVINKEDKKIIDFCLNDKEVLDFRMLSRSIWNSLQKSDFKNDTDCWIVPIRLNLLKDKYICIVDILRKINSKKQKIKKSNL